MDDERSEHDWQSLLGNLTQEHDGKCPYPCPFCSGAELLRQVNPEVAAHLATAGKEFLLAAKTFIDSLADKQSGHKPDDGPEKIPFDQ